MVILGRAGYAVHPQGLARGRRGDQPPAGDGHGPVQRRAPAGPGRPLRRRLEARRQHEPHPAEIRPAVPGDLPRPERHDPAAAAAPDPNSAAPARPRPLRLGRSVAPRPLRRLLALAGSPGAPGPREARARLAPGSRQARPLSSSLSTNVPWEHELSSSLPNHALGCHEPSPNVHVWHNAVGKGLPSWAAVLVWRAGALDSGKFVSHQHIRGGIDNSRMSD